MDGDRPGSRQDPPLIPLSISSPQSRDRKMVGDVIGAQTYASTAKCLNICALVLGILLTIIFIILFFTGALVFSVNTMHTIRQQRGYH